MIKTVCDGADTGGEMDILPNELGGIARAIGMFVVLVTGH
jgi:hypothetical protein